MSKLRTVAQAAEDLSLTRRAVIHRIKAGSIEASKIGEGRTSAYVITAEEIARILAESK
jgi:hypothetical protein